jgi:hypothetical protein
MKKMTCRQLGGACDKEFYANSFEEMAEQSKKHAKEMFQVGDADHIRAMTEMQERMKSPDFMSNWFENRKREFDALPEESS